jgi:hypothetical protein
VVGVGRIAYGTEELPPKDALTRVYAKGRIVILVDRGFVQGGADESGEEELVLVRDVEMRDTGLK